MPMEVPWFRHNSPKRRYLVGVSGGADSTALLHLLSEAGFHDLVVCHLNHGLRGRESDGDAQFVTTLAKSLKLPCEISTVNVAQLSANHGESLETAGRNARHQFFSTCARKHRCPRVLLAHHADDQAETILWNLMRGSLGAKGMRETRSLSIQGRKLELIRPLLSLRRDDLRHYLRDHHLTWREDSSNAEPFTLRNRLRSEGIPLLREIAGREIIPSLCRAAEAVEDLAIIADWALDQAKPFDPQGRLHLPTLRQLPVALQRSAIARLLTESSITDLSRELLDRCLLLLEENGPHAVNLPGDRQLRRRQGRLLIP